MGIIGISKILDNTYKNDTYNKILPKSERNFNFKRLMVDPSD